MTLYRKYRSQKLSEIIGQPQVVEMLGQAVSRERIAHAYLFAGPRGTGKTSVARILAKAINCLSDDPKVEVPCNKCANCLAITKGSFLDVVEIDAASHNKVEDARELIEQIHSVPSIGKYKVYILDEVHMLSNAAFNALLKTLEEPPAHAVFILCTTENHKVPITVASRCQRFVFARANQAQLRQLLKSIADKEKIKIEDQAIALLAQLADGGYRDGVMLLDQAAAMHKEVADEAVLTRGALERQLGLASQQITQQVVENAFNKDVEAAIGQIETFVKDGGEVRYLLNDMVEQVRLLMLYLLKADVAQEGIDQAQSQWFDSLKTSVSIHEATVLLKRLVEAKHQKTSAEHAALSLEMAVIEYASHPSSATVNSTTDAPGSTRPAAQPAPRKQPPSVPKTPTQTVEESALVATAITQPSNPEVDAPPAKQTNPTPTPEPFEPPADLAEAWKQVLVGVQQQSRSVAALLQHHCTPLSHDGTILMLQFWNAFHKRQVEVDKNRIIVEKVATSIFGQPVKIQGELADKSLRPKKRPMTEEDLHNVAEPDNDLTDVAAEIFGGEFVEE